MTAIGCRERNQAGRLSSYLLDGNREIKGKRGCKVGGVCMCVYMQWKKGEAVVLNWDKLELLEGLLLPGWPLKEQLVLALIHGIDVAGNPGYLGLSYRSIWPREPAAVVQESVCVLVLWTCAHSRINWSLYCHLCRCRCCYHKSAIISINLDLRCIFCMSSRMYEWHSGGNSS